MFQPENADHFLGQLVPRRRVGCDIRDGRLCLVRSRGLCFPEKKEEPDCVTGLVDLPRFLFPAEFVEKTG